MIKQFSDITNRASVNARRHQLLAIAEKSGERDRQNKLSAQKNPRNVNSYGPKAIFRKLANSDKRTLSKRVI